MGGREEEAQGRWQFELSSRYEMLIQSASLLDATSNNTCPLFRQNLLYSRALSQILSNLVHFPHILEHLEIDAT